MKRIIAIDPGALGGIAWINGEEVTAIRMPNGMTCQADALQSLAMQKPDLCYLEKVGTYVSGNAGPSAVKFARHCGNLEAILYVLNIPTIQISPSKWMAAFGTMPKEKTPRKNKIKEEVQRLYPHLGVTLNTSDALGILTYAMKQEK